MTVQAERRATERPVKEWRHIARELALQMLYQWEVGRLSMDEVQQTFWTCTDGQAQAPSDDVRQLATRFADGVAGEIAGIDPMIVESADHWRLERMNVLDRLILRMAIFELLHEPGTPGKVVINEALELARTFSGDESVRFVNGVLDAVRRKLERA